MTLIIEMEPSSDTEMVNHVNPTGVGTFKRACGAGPLMLTVAAAILASSPTTLAHNSDNVKAGLALWKTAGCADCHGPFADGDREDDDFPIGANLRTTKLDSAALKMTIRCGRADTGMPSFDEEAYTTRECYGRPQGTRPGNLQPTPRTLTLDEIGAVIAYLQASIIGRGKITREECLSYYEDQPDTCEDYK
jgi:mono/diheme cytochrome c family protein